MHELSFNPNALNFRLINPLFKHNYSICPKVPVAGEIELCVIVLQSNAL